MRNRMFRKDTNCYMEKKRIGYNKKAIDYKKMEKARISKYNRAIREITKGKNLERNQRVIQEFKRIEQQRRDYELRYHLREFNLKDIAQLPTYQQLQTFKRYLRIDRGEYDRYKQRIFRKNYLKALHNMGASEEEDYLSGFTSKQLWEMFDMGYIDDLNIWYPKKDDNKNTPLLDIDTVKRTISAVKANPILRWKRRNYRKRY